MTTPSQISRAFLAAALPAACTQSADAPVDVSSCRQRVKREVRVQMKRGAAIVDRAELIKWWDALDDLHHIWDVEQGLQMARECRHPDAQWLPSCFRQTSP
jgi:hypothetical protein